MAATGFTPFQLYRSSTPGQVPLAANLKDGELAINVADGLLFYKNTSGAVAQFSSSAGSVSTISFGTTGLTPSTASSGTVTVAGTLVAASGGTGLSSYTTGDVIYASGSTALSKLALGTNGYVMTAGATAPGWTAQSALSVGSATTATNVAGGAANRIAYQSGAGATTFITAPTDGTFLRYTTAGGFSWTSAVGGGSVTSVDVSGGTTGLTTSGGPVTTSGTITLAGTLVTSNGGTGLTTYTAGDILYYTSGTALSKLGIGASSYVLTSSGTAPQYVAQSTLSVGSAATAASATTSTNIAGGAAGSLPYQSAAATTTYLPLGTQNHLLRAGAAAPEYASLNTVLDGLTTTQGSVIYRGVSGWTALTPGTAGYLLTTNGAGADPSWSAAATSGVTSISFGSTGLTPNSASTGAISVAGTLGTGYGGTGLTTFTAGGAVYASNASTLTTGTLPTTAGGTGLTSFTSGGAVYASNTSTLTTGTLPASAGGTGNSSYTSGDLLYASSSTGVGKLAIGSANQILSVTSSLPTWNSLSTLLDSISSTQGVILYRGASSWSALAPSTAGYLLSTQGAAANPTWVAGVSGITGYTGALNTASPNATNNVSSLTASGGTAIQFAALVPKSTGGVLAAIPDSAATGGNVRGATSVDWQTNRSAATMVASGTNSVIGGGQDNTASGTGSIVAGGYTQVVSSNYGASLGGAFGSVTGNYSSNLGGLYSTDRGVYGTVANAGAYSYGGTTYGALLRTSRLLGASTTDATTTVLSTTGAAASATNQVVLANNSAIYFTARIVATVTNGGDTKSWTIEGTIKRGNTAGTTALVGSTITNLIAANTGAASWTVAAAANTSLGCLQISVTGQAAVGIRWACEVQTVEATF